MQSIIRERIIQQLCEIPKLVDQYASSSSDFPRNALLWVRACEQALEPFRLPLVSELSSLRGLMLSCDEGYTDPQIIPCTTRSPRKAKRVMIMHLLHRAEKVMRHHCDGIDSVFDDYRDKFSQLLAVASSKSPLPASANITTGYIDQVWKQTIDAQNDSSLVQYLQARVTLTDRRYLLENLLSNLLNNIQAGDSNKQGKRRN